MIETMIPKSNALNPRESLSKVVQSLLVLTMTGCCRDIQYSQDEVDYEGVIEGELLDAIRAEHAEPADRCEAACLELILAGEPEVEQCEAAGASNVEDPWAPENVEVTIMCVGVYSEPVSCSGRPSGHL